MHALVRVIGHEWRLPCGRLNREPSNNRGRGNRSGHETLQLLVCSRALRSFFDSNRAFIEHGLLLQQPEAECEIVEGRVPGNVWIP